MVQATRGLADALHVQLRQRLDMGLFVVVAILIGAGLVMVASSSIGVAEKDYGDPFHFVTRQAVYVGIGIFLAYLFYEIPLRLWETAGMLLLALAVLLL
ncbi:MAG TPA: cell division protein FtsW, partial [Gammaproteobacteria bacterium]|nr:cell division protein FtsW [Gammaproteobacteria bacterium]